MNIQIEKKRATEYVILCFALLCILLVGPVGLLDRTRQISGNETVSGVTQTVGAGERIQQVFIADGGHLESVGIYASSDLSRKVFRFSIYDELGETLFSRNVALDAYEAPGFFSVPVEIDTVAGRAYVWQISQAETEFALGWQETARAGIGIYGNYYYVGADDRIQEQVGYNIPMRLVYSAPVSAAGKAGLIAGICVIAGFFVLLIENRSRQRGQEPTVSVQWAVRRVGNPLIAVGAAAGLAMVLTGYYGGVKADRMVYCAGILVLAALLFYVVNVKRENAQASRPSFGQVLADKGMDWLQTLFWAGALWGCIDYVNAMYNIYQDYAYRKTLIYFGLALLAMCGKKAVFRLYNLIWIAAASVAGYLYWRPCREDAELSRLRELNAILFVVIGLLVIQICGMVWRMAGRKRGVSAESAGRDKDARDTGRTPWKELSVPYTALVLFFFVLIVAFRNTRGWPIDLAVSFALFYFFYLCWDKRERFLEIFCNGIILNFVIALVFAVLRRPFRAWIFYRYNFVFHTVTVTAAYLTLVLCALFVKLLLEYHRSRRLYAWWKCGLLFGMAASLLLMTLSRTGYLAAVVMGLVVLVFTAVCYRERILYFAGKAGVLVLVVLLCFPVTYSAVRLIPPLYDDPYIFELEAHDEQWAVHKGDPADSENYITFPRFAYCLDVKLFGDEHSILRKFVDTFMADAGAAVRTGSPDTELSVAGISGMLASAQDGAGELPESAAEESAEDSDGEGQSGPAEDEEDYSNGRLEIFKRYIAQWNLTGHDEMGVELADGSLSVHAHNTYLQVIHDHGLITGLVYLLLGAVSLVQMFRYAWKHLRIRGAQETDAYAALPLAVFLAFAVAGLVEWLFHPCNPLGFATMVILAPLLTFKNRKQSRNEG